MKTVRAAVRRPIWWAALPLTVSWSSGFFFWGMMLLVPAKASSSSTMPNSSVVQRKMSWWIRFRVPIMRVSPKTASRR